MMALCQRHVRAVLLYLGLLATFAPFCVADAQVAASDPRMTEVRPWLVGVGAETLEPLRTTIDGVRFQAGVAAHVGYERRVGSTPLGARLGMSFVHRPRGDGQDVHAFGFGLTGTYALASGRTRPYLLAGVGVDNTGDASRIATSFGAGALARVGRSWMFVEARLTTYPTVGGVSGQPIGLLPVTVGLRF